MVRADTERRGLIFAGTDVGAFASWDDGAHWRGIQGALPTAWVRDLLVRGDDLIAGTQGRSIWVLGDLALLRQADQTLGPVHLFRPADAVRVRANTNHDTPISPEEPVGKNPPGGAAIDYALARPAKGPVTVEIRDAAGTLVRELSSQPGEPPPAERYFAHDWLRAARPLETSAGLHHALWDLHWTRPPLLGADYSIATAYGEGVALLPEGPLALPGAYTVTLRADGRTETRPLTLTPDPRAPLDPAALRASFDLSRSIGESLGLARRGYGEMSVAHRQAVALGTPSDATVAAAVAAFAAHSAPPEHAGFLEANGILASIESDLEAADLAPTQPQRDAAAATSRRIAALWSAWSATRDRDLSALNASLARARLKPIAIPPANELTISLPDGGEDLP